MDDYLSYLLVITLDGLTTKLPDFDSVYKEDHLTEGNLEIAQYIYNDSYSNGNVEIKIHRNWTSPVAAKDSEHILAITDAFRAFTKLTLSQVDHKLDYTLCKYTKPKSETPVETRTPLDLDWLITQKDSPDVIDNKK